MFRELGKIKRYEFKNKYTHYVDICRELQKEETNLLSQLLASFPNASDADWPNKFLLLDFTQFPKEILYIATNAYDFCGNTVLGVACEYGEVESVQKLITHGAYLNTRDNFVNKLAIHWAIANRLSELDKDSYEAAGVVKCLLENGARTDITCYENTTPFKYAQSRGYKAAANLIQAYMRIYLRGATIGLFKDTFHRDISGHIANFLTEKDNMNIAMTRKDAYNAAEAEKKLTNISCFLKKI